MKGVAIKYSHSELDWVKSNCTLPIRELHAQFCNKFDRNDVVAKNLAALRKRNGWKTGRTGFFEKGHETWNKGKPHPSTGGAKETQFKKGRQPHNANYLGHERVSKDGYIEISVADKNSNCGRRYVLKHKHLWEKKNGKVKRGYCLKCLDGDRQNCDPENWVEIKRSLLPSLARRGYDQYPKELKPTVMTICRVEQAAREIKQGGIASE